MCGIVGAVGRGEVGNLSIDGLIRLESRGYDSAGIGYANTDQDKIVVHKTLGGVEDLRSKVSSFTNGAVIGHSRWATHGEASIKNAHPHCSGEKICIVHNGIIENFTALRDELKKSGFEFISDTDSEVISHCIQNEFNLCQDWQKALINTCAKLKGAWAIGLIVAGEDTIYLAKQGSPLVIGIGDGINFMASSIFGLSGVTNEFMILDDGEFAAISGEDIKVFSTDGDAILKDIHKSEINYQAQSLESNDSYMIKEIEEQPDVILNTLVGADGDTDSIFGEGSKKAFGKIESIKIVACGTSFHAGMVGKYWIENFCDIRVDVELASEVAHRKRAIVENELCIFISQSGETADTISAIKRIKEDGCQNTLTICNTNHSEMVRLTDYHFITRAGIEIGVASTKAFTTQLIALYSLSKHISLSRGTDFGYELNQSRLIEDINRVLDRRNEIYAVAKIISRYKSCIFIGRGELYPIAMEGALKLKEISYIHAEAYAAGELKHGPLALIDEDMPVIAISFSGGDSKMNSSIEEIKSRNGKVFIFDEGGHDPIKTPILMAIALQLLSYSCAKALGRDVDKPRNLAKSVTVS
jgi:glucosamine--fructose-6-phosphate aminotransferase (isomerizing)